MAVAVLDVDPGFIGYCMSVPIHPWIRRENVRSMDRVAGFIEIGFAVVVHKLDVECQAVFMVDLEFHSVE